jgi:hypothetical protein
MQLGHLSLLARRPIQVAALALVNEIARMV